MITRGKQQPSDQRPASRQAKRRASPHQTGSSMQRPQSSGCSASCRHPRANASSGRIWLGPLGVAVMTRPPRSPTRSGWLEQISTKRRSSPNAASTSYLRAAGVNLDFGLQRRADLAGLAQRFQRLGDFAFHHAHWATVSPAPTLRPAPAACARWTASHSRPAPTRHCQISSAVKERMAPSGGSPSAGCATAHFAPQRGAGIGGGGVQAILEDVEIKRAQVLGAEIHAGLHDLGNSKRS
jgi:hypothetical protein